MSTNTILASAPLTTTNFVLKANGTTIGNSLIWDNGTNVGIGNTNTSYTLDVSGTLRNTTSAYFATTSGNVGIGRTDPTRLLDVSALGTAYIRASDRTNSVNVDIYAASSGGGIGTQTNHDFILQTNNTERMRIRSDGSILFSTTASITTDNNNITPYSGNGYFYIMGGSTGLALTGSGNRNNGIYINSTNNEMYFQINNLGTRMMLTSGGNLLIGTTTDSSYKLAVASGIQYLGAGFQITGTFGQTDRQCATAFADFSGTTCTFDLASLFPRTTFLNRGLSVTMQLVALPTYTIVSSGFVVLARTGNSNVWSNTILANININGAAINSVTANGTVITVNYSTYIFGTAYINLATIG